MNSQIQSVEEKIFYAVIQLINNGDRHITRYKVANALPSTSRSRVYEIFDKYKKGNSNAIKCK